MRAPLVMCEPTGPLVAQLLQSQQRAFQTPLIVSTRQQPSLRLGCQELFA